VPTDSQGRIVTDGEVELSGVAGTGVGIKVEFLTPGFNSQGRVFPTGNVVDVLKVPHVWDVEAT